MCWKRRKSNRFIGDPHHQQGKSHFFFDRCVYYLHGQTSTTFTNNEDRLLDLRSKYSLTYCMISVTLGYLLGIIGFIADDWVTMVAFSGKESNEHIPYQTEEPNVRLRKGLVISIDYFMVKDAMFGSLTEELNILEISEKCTEETSENDPRSKVNKDVQAYWSLSRAYAIVTLICSTWVVSIILSTVLSNRWPTLHMMRNKARRMTTKMVKTKTETTESVTSGTALNIGQATFLTCYCFTMTCCNYNSLMSVLSTFERNLRKTIVCVEFPGYNYYFTCASFMLMIFAFMYIIDAYDTA